MKTVLIKRGYGHGRELFNVRFPLVKDIRPSQRGLFVTVSGEGVSGFPQRNFNIWITDESDIVVSNTGVELVPVAAAAPTEPVIEETDQQIKDRVAERFNVLKDLTRGAADGKLKGLIVAGAPGTGKSYEVERELSRANFYDFLSFNDEAEDQDPARIRQDEQGRNAYKPKYEIIKGHISAAGLYRTLYDNSEPNAVLVLDDCDSALYDDTALNLIKSALDTSRKRMLSWVTSNPASDLPSKFEYKGAVIFVSNINFEKSIRAGSKLAPHLAALMDRCFYLDMTIDTIREKLLRIEQVSMDFGMLRREGLDESESREVIEFTKTRAHEFRELSLRKVVQLAQLRKMGGNWTRKAEITLLRGVR